MRPLYRYRAPPGAFCKPGLHVILRRRTMSDNLQQRNGADRQRINVNEDYELRDWAKKFGVTEDQLRKAVAAVGPTADKVEQYLKTGSAHH